MAVDVQKVVKECEVCKITKTANKNDRPPMGEQRDTERSGQRSFIDFMGPYPRTKPGNSVIFVCLDHFSKFVWLQAMRHAVAAEVIKFLETKIFHQYEVPEFIHSDNGKHFVSQIFGELMTRYGIRHVRTGVSSPQANAAESVNRSVLQILRATIATDQRNSDTQLSRIGCALRNGLHESIGMEPYYAMFGTRMVTDGTAYPILRKLGGIQAGDPQISLPDKMELIR